MNGEDRRKEIVRSLGREPCTATALARRLGVSRQVIVQDVAILRAEGARILSTNRGYVAAGAGHARVFKVRHSDAEVREELYLVADAGGRVEDVFVWHKVYGKIVAPMHIASRRAADEFMQQLESGVSVPLKNVTGGYHYHTVSADSEAVLDRIEGELRARGFLAEGE